MSLARRIGLVLGCTAILAGGAGGQSGAERGGGGGERAAHPQEIPAAEILALHRRFVAAGQPIETAGDLLLEGTREEYSVTSGYRAFIRWRPFAYREEVVREGSPRQVFLSDGSWAPVRSCLFRGSAWTPPGERSNSIPVRRSARMPGGAS